MAEVLAVIIGLIGLVGFLGLFVALSAMFNGWVFSNLWLWFIVPIFHLPALSIVQAIGVSFVVSSMRPGPKSEDKPDGKKTTREIGQGLIAKLILLGIAWCLKTWFM